MHGTLNCAVPESIHIPAPPTSPATGHWKFRGGGVIKTKLLEELYGAKTGILSGWRVTKQETFQLWYKSVAREMIPAGF